MPDSMARGRKREPAGVGDLISAALRQSGLSNHAQRLAVYRSWDLAVGPEIAARTSPETLRRGVLLVRASSATWQNELTFLKRELIDKLNQHLGPNTITDLKIVSGHVVRPPPPPPPTPLPPVTREQAAAAAATALVIGDDTVRDVFRRSMQNYLRSGRRR
jgi:hypothetical protein